MRDVPPDAAELKRNSRHFPAVDVGEAEIEHDHRLRPLHGHVERFAAGRDRTHVEAELGQVRA
jgi:hypothetical protein